MLKLGEVLYLNRPTAERNRSPNVDKTRSLTTTHRREKSFTIKIRRREKLSTHKAPPPKETVHLSRSTAMRSRSLIGLRRRENSFTYLTNRRKFCTHFQPRLFLEVASLFSMERPPNTKFTESDTCGKCLM